MAKFLKGLEFIKFNLLIGFLITSIILMAIATPIFAVTIPIKTDLTPILVSPIANQSQPVLGIDNKYHLLYELKLSNASQDIAKLKSIEILDARNLNRIIFQYEDKTLVSRLKNLGIGSSNVTSDLEVNGSRLFLIDLLFNSVANIPTGLVHRLNLETRGAKFSYVVAPISLVSKKVVVISAPLSGKHWVDINGCCQADISHRRAGLPINGDIFFAQRFAIDWMQLDNKGRLAHDDLTRVNNYTSYGAKILAVADGTVISTQNNLGDQIPPNSPDPSKINMSNVLGNHVILKLDNNLFAVYAHLQKDSVRVKLGQKVKRNQVIGLLGNTGNSSAPHLHFHLSNSPSLGSDGVPYVFDNFKLSGQIPIKDIESVYEFTNDLRKYLTLPSLRTKQFPLNLTIVDFS